MYMAKSRFLSCAAQGRKKTDKLPVIFLAVMETHWLTHLTTMSLRKQTPSPTFKSKKKVNIFLCRAAEISTRLMR